MTDITEDAGASAVRWPDWPLSPKSVADLAGYVDDGRAADFVPSDVVSPWGGRPAEGPARVERLYESLRSRHIPYAAEPWNMAVSNGEASCQRVRGVEAAIRGPATCLDLALLFAGMCLAADLRPLVAVTWHRVPHAVVLVDIHRSLGTSRPLVSLPDEFVPRVGEPGVLDGGPIDRGRLRRAGWAVVDVVHAAVSDETWGYADSGKTMESSLYRQATWSLVDVAYLQKEPGFHPYVEPTGPSRPPIHGYLPARRSFREYPSRRQVVADLFDQICRLPRRPPTVLVIKAPQGYGKSRLALEIASAADHNAGWFLAANDRETLIASLASAERSELPTAGADIAGHGEKPDPGEDLSVAAAALTRLRNSLAPWVVVLDNCDQDPQDKKVGVWSLLPIPRAEGQTLVVTTTDPAWPPLARAQGWKVVELEPLRAEDLRDLHLPETVDSAVAGRPLVAESLGELVTVDSQLPAGSLPDGPALMWSLFLQGASHLEAAQVARTLAWCPPEPVETSVIPGGGDEGLRCCEILTKAGLVSSQRAGGREEVEMHRLVAAAIRDQTWEGEEDEARAAVRRVCLNDAGRAILLRAHDQTALRWLENSEVKRAATPPSRTGGQLWHAVGHIRERRGPVALSAQHFNKAMPMLDEHGDARAYAECLMGVARVTYQASKDPTRLRAAGAQVGQATVLLQPFTDVDSRQMGEQANALGLLIRQKIVESESAGDRLGQFLEIRDGLWASYEARRALAREKNTRELDPRSPPTPEDGLGSERAFYNLAGVNLQVAKEAHALNPTDGVVVEALAEAERVYNAVRRLRQHRYEGRPHPHLAACVHGLAIVTYYRAIFGLPGADPVSSIQLAGEALAQRSAVVVGLQGDGSAVVHDNDVRKSVEFLIKATLLADIVGVDGVGGSGRAHAIRVLAEAMEEYERA